jgi:hypothetical protein
VHLFDWHVEFEPPQISVTPLGTQRNYVIRSGVCNGDRLRGRFLPGGGDAILFGPDGVGRLDIRATLRTDDDQLIFVTGTGIVAIPPPALERLRAGEAIRWDEMYMRWTPRFATGSESHSWLNSIVAVSVNDLGPNSDQVHRVGHRVFQVL